VKTRHSIILIAAALLTVGCGESQSITSPSGVTPSHGSGTLSAQSVEASSSPRFSTLTECSTITYVGPIRLPISVHGTTAFLSWLGSDDAIRGYYVEFERYDVTNVWVPAMHDTVVKPEAKEFLRTEGTYRVRVRGLFCNDGVGPFTDWVVFSTDDTEDHSVTPPVIIPPPPPGDHGGHCDGDHNDDGHNDCGDNGNPPDNPGGGNDNPGPPNDPPGGGNPGGGGPPPCILLPTGHGDHPAPGGDHNDDGHNDCGVGNQNQSFSIR